ncbi:MAG TPA: PH domain-containing protein [Candidatus Magasanikbacteria bacterium]|nr:PH domain-containing protein [Candidatus Magasanikbacteria bacterium]
MIISHLIKQKDYEKVLFVLRRHPITFVPQIILFIILLSVPFVMYFLFQNLYTNFFNNTILEPISVLVASAYYLGVLLFFYGQFIDFYLDLWIVTNDRVVDIEQKGLFARTISEVDLYRIQDVTTEIHGFIGTIFNYGDVIIKTASNNSEVVFIDVADPNFLRHKLIEMSQEDRKYHSNEA